MALRTPPSWLQNGSHTAENDRLSMQGIFRSSGILNPTDLAVTQSGTPAMSVSVASGWAEILGTFQSNMGAYQVFNDAATTLTVTTADPTNPRIDLVVIAVQDAFYTGATNTVVFQVVAGTPAGSPVAPSAPANSIVLAQIAVAALATTIVNANITDKRQICQTPFDRAGFTTQATANSTLILTGTSNPIQEFTGTTAGQVVQEPDVTTLYKGWWHKVSNKYTQTIAVNSSGGNLIATVPANTDWLFVCNAITGTTAASWSNSYAGASAAPSSGATVNTYRKTSGQTITSTITLTDDTTLQFAVSANQVWMFELVLYVTCPAGGANIRVAMTDTAATSVKWGFTGSGFYNTAGTFAVSRSQTGGVYQAHYVDNVETPIRISGVVNQGATPGTLKLQWCQDTSSANGVTVGIGSYMVATLGA